MLRKVALLVGGWSSEREVSLAKGRAVEQALRDKGYIVQVIDVRKDPAALVRALENPRPDIVFNNLYGRGGEDGTVQALLDMMELPYVHSSLRASAITMDKPITKRLAKTVGIQSPEGYIATREDVLAGMIMEPPYVVKPLDEGSSVGVKIVFEKNGNDVLDADAWAFGEKVLVERYIPGREIHVTVLDGKAQGVTEIITPSLFFDYEAKYHSPETELITPADIPAEIAETAMDWAERIFKITGCAGLARCDLRYDDAKTGSEAVYFLEINTMPGLSEGSIAAIQPMQSGMSFADLCAHMIETALWRHQQSQNQDESGHQNPDPQNPQKAAA